MSLKNELPSPQVEADYKLLQYYDYEDYLASYIEDIDHCYVDDREALNTMIRHGYKNSSGLTETEFYIRKQAVTDYYHPQYTPFENASKDVISTDPLLLALAFRERANRVGIISTIIHMRCKLKSGAKISGYIDYGDKLLRQDWKPIFMGEVQLKPDRTDLGYYNCQTGESITNSSVYFKASFNDLAQLVYTHKFDRKDVVMDPKNPPGYYSTRTRIQSPAYEQCSLIDHVLRQRR